MSVNELLINLMRSPHTSPEKQKAAFSLWNELRTWRSNVEKEPTTKVQPDIDFCVAQEIAFIRGCRQRNDTRAIQQFFTASPCDRA